MLTSTIATGFQPNNAFADENSEKNNDKKITICHIPPGNPNNAHTISISHSALNAHFNHSDYIGECSPDNEKPTEEPPAEPPNNNKKITICHIPLGNPDNSHTITISESALGAHLTHGDYGGACVTNDIDPPDNEKPVYGPQLPSQRFKICHNPGNSESAQVIFIDKFRLNSHLKHGDYVGICITKNIPDPPKPAQPIQAFSYNYVPRDIYAICHNNPGNSNDPYSREMVSGVAVQAHLYIGDYLGKCNLDELGNVVTVCHNNGEGHWATRLSADEYTPSSFTVRIDKSDLESHLSHGDYEGKCRSYLDDPKVKMVDHNRETRIHLDEYDLKQKFPICHYPEGDRRNGVLMITSDISYHLSHGDHLGKCQDEKLEIINESYFSDETQSFESRKIYTMCHYESDESKMDKTIFVPLSQTHAHLYHGDAWGTCSN